MKIKSIYQFSFVVCLVLLICAVFTPLSASAVSYVKNPSDAHGSDYTNSYSLAKKLDEVFAGDIDIYSNSACTTEVSMPIGTSMSNSTQYYVKSKTSGNLCSGWQCYIYANAVYNKLNNEWVGNGGTFAHSETVISGGSNKLTYDMLKNAGVRCGAYMRTTNSSSGAFSGNYGHSLVILSYNSTSITYLEGNGDGNGAVRLTTETWSEFNIGELSGRSRYIAHIVQPTSSYYSSTYEKDQYEIAYFPMKYLNITQGVNGSYSHQGTKALDLAGIDGGKDAVYAPFTGVIKKIYTSSGNFVWLESSNPVVYADGTVDYMTIMVGHDNDVSDLYVGKVINQGEAFYSEGTAGNATGNHIHLECAKGKYKTNGWYENSYGQWTIYNSILPYDALVLKNDVVIKSDYGYNWRKSPTMQSTIIPATITEDTYYFSNDGYKMYMISDASARNTIGASNGEVSSKYQFKVTKDGEKYKVAPVDGKNGYLLNVWWLSQTLSTAGDEITLHYSTGDLSQRWIFEKYGSGYLIHPADNTKLSVTREGSKLYLRATTNADSQIWSLIPVKCTHLYDNSCDIDCNVCGHIRSDITHEYGNMYFVDSEYHREDCENCGAYRVYTHTFTSDCDDYCEDCDYHRAASHTYDNACDPTCNICGEERETSHEYDNACDTTCNVCGHTRIVFHSYKTVEYTEEGHWFICNDCGYTTNLGEHLFGEFVSEEPTCTEAGEKHTMCVTCGYDIVEEIEPLGHTYGDFTVTKEPTCTESGEKIRTCERCGDSVTEEIAPTEHTYDKYVIVEQATCEENGSKEKTCSSCGDVVTEVIPAKGHDYGDWYTVGSDANGNETERRDCYNCGHYEINVVEVDPEPNPEPQTFWEIIMNFFESIIAWFAELFS